MTKTPATPKIAAIQPETAKIIEKGHALHDTTKPTAAVLVDKREIAREEHTNHLTNREGNKN